MKFATMTSDQLKSVERTLSGGTWVITFGAVLFSVLTVTPLVAEVTPKGWSWTAPLLPIVVDAAVVIVIRLDATVARLGQSAGRWPLVLRWLTGLMTLALNVGKSALAEDWVGVAVHAVAPLLLIVTAEASLGYRRAISRALDEQETARREQAAADRREHREREDRERHERETREVRERETRERDQEREDRRVRDQREHEARLAEQERQAQADRLRQQAETETARLREEREHQRELTREKTAAAEAERKATAARRDETERKTKERETRERTPAEATSAPHEKAVSTSREIVSATQKPTVSASVSTEKLPENDALTVIEQGVQDGMSTRQLASMTGWSSGWVAARAKEVRVAA